MPIQHAIWKVGAKPEPLTVSKLATEKHLEDMIMECPAILSGEWMLIGRQEKTGFGGIIDLLAITPDGSWVPIDLIEMANGGKRPAMSATHTEGMARRAI